MNLNEILSPQSIDGSGASFGNVLSLEPFNAKVFFEAHPDMFRADRGKIEIQLFAGSNPGQSCGKGTLLVSSVANKIETSFYPKPDVKDDVTRSANGIIGKQHTHKELFHLTNKIVFQLDFDIGVSEFVVQDYRGSLNSPIFFPNSDNGSGQIRICE
eukprot:jgi/Psemu1/37487/gm1.37487_g